MNHQNSFLLIKTKKRIFIKQIIRVLSLVGILIIFGYSIASKSAYNCGNLLQQPRVPDPPRNLVLSINTIGGIRLHWEPPIYDGGSPILGYNPYYWSDEYGGIYLHYLKVMGNQTTIDLQYNEIYNTTWVITALNEYGESEYSNEVNLIIPSTEFDFIKGGLQVLMIFFGCLTLIFGYKEFKTYFDRFLN